MDEKRVDHVLAAIDGAIDWDPADGDAMTWAPKAPKPPVLPVPHIDPEAARQLFASINVQVQAFVEAFRPFAEHAAHTLRTLAEIANRPEVRAAIDAYQRGDVEPDLPACNCFCGVVHSDRMGICQVDAVTILVRHTPSLGRVETPVCQACWDALPVVATCE